MLKKCNSVWLSCCFLYTTLVTVESTCQENKLIYVRVFISLECNSTNNNNILLYLHYDNDVKWCLFIVYVQTHITSVEK